MIVDYFNISFYYLSERQEARIYNSYKQILKYIFDLSDYIKLSYDLE